MADVHAIAFCIVVTVLQMITSSLGDTCKGCVELDEHSFAKLVPKFRYTLVKFDIAYPYGPKHDAFVQFAESVHNNKDIIAGNVGIKDYGAKDNSDFAVTQDVDPTKLPVIKLYKGLDNVATYNDEELTVEKLQEFVVENSDVHITLAGCVEDFDKLAHRFVHGSNEDKVVILKNIVESETHDDSQEKAKKIYSLYMRKLLDDRDFVEKELKRLGKIISEGNISEAKMQDLQNKINILHAFETKAKHSKTEL